MNRPTAHSRKAFTLIELMVTIAIIALLISIMIPAFSAVRNNANVVATQALFQGLDVGLESYRGERALGGVYPPSRTDNGLGSFVMANPFFPAASNAPNVMVITGANLLAYGLVGADQLGTPGFRDLDVPPDGTWSDDQQGGIVSGTAYAINPATSEPFETRYPGGGATYVDETTRGSLRSLRQLVDDGVALADPDELPGVAEQLMFTDHWGHPVLYYRANRAGPNMIRDPNGANGIYNLQDNALFTGYQDSVPQMRGIDFGPGRVANNFYSEIARSEYPPLRPEFVNDQNRILVDPNYDHTFERFILDRSMTSQNRPVNACSYLLISAGADAIYGTTDDITNWERAEQ